MDFFLNCCCTFVQIAITYSKVQFTYIMYVCKILLTLIYVVLVFIFTLSSFLCHIFRELYYFSKLMSKLCLNSFINHFLKNKKKSKTTRDGSGSSILVQVGSDRVINRRRPRFGYPDSSLHGGSKFRFRYIEQ